VSQRLSPPQAPKYLERPYPSTQKGGTLIAEDVTDLETHQGRLSDPDGYRPPRCPRCGHGKLHVHDYRSRELLGEPRRRKTEGTVSITVVRHRCANPECKAHWRTLPALLARHLRRRWEVVEAATVGSRRPGLPPVPERTRRRWRTRLRMSARVLTQVLAASGSAALEAIARRVGLSGTRLDVVVADGGPLSAVAELLHRLAPGLRLM
jgi:hypothetical protein